MKKLLMIAALFAVGSQIEAAPYPALSRIITKGKGLSVGNKVTSISFNTKGKTLAKATSSKQKDGQTRSYSRYKNRYRRNCISKL